MNRYAPQAVVLTPIRALCAGERTQVEVSRLQFPNGPRHHGEVIHRTSICPAVVAGPPIQGSVSASHSISSLSLVLIPLVANRQRDQASQSQVCPPLQWDRLEHQVGHTAENS